MEENKSEDDKTDIGKPTQEKPEVTSAPGPITAREIIGPIIEFAIATIYMLLHPFLINPSYPIFTWSIPSSKIGIVLIGQFLLFLIVTGILRLIKNWKNRVNKTVFFSFVLLGVVLVIMAFAFIYNQFYHLDEGYFTGFIIKDRSYLDFAYFSTATIATVGFGDINANSTITRMLVVEETFFGIFLLIIVMSQADSIMKYIKGNV